ncbi:MAG: hypothetical protein EOP10_02065 [Proteobacteria bacterium]|nr:MAG: hypothetical protein EOP10_02065 [Pseudomonadota bacterium]
MLQILLTLLIFLSQTAAAQSFVRADGQRFTLDGQAFYFQGTNSYDAGLLGSMSEDAVYQRFRDIGNSGIKVVRIWGFSCRDQYYAPMITGIRDGQVQYDEAAMQRLDLALDAARVAGVRIIFPLVNYEPDVCGMNFWVKEITGSEDKHQFYWHNDVKSVFKNHVATLLNRTNTRRLATTGQNVSYKNDPTIFAIELANEPHTLDSFEQNQGQQPGTMVYNWLNEMSTFVRGIDGNHMISSGEEGYKVSHGDLSRHSWIHNGLKGVDFERNITIPNISFVTVHIYPDNWGISSSEFDFVERELIADRARLAHSVNKPIVLEETGFARGSTFGGQGYSNNPQDWLSRIYSAANANNFAGTMVWQAVPGGYTGGYNFNFDDIQFQVVRDQARFMNGKSGSPTSPQCTNIAPDSLYTCEQQASWGKCGEVWMQNFCRASCGGC